MNNNFIESQYILPTPVGKLELVLNEEGISNLSYVADNRKARLPKKGLAYEVFRQLEEYFNCKRKTFDLPLSLEGTEYQKRVWRRVRKITYGQSLTYGSIAKQLASGPRAVGNACRMNPVLILVPCHRVVSKTDIGGYTGKVAGRAIERKILLLAMEGGLSDVHM